MLRTPLTVRHDWCKVFLAFPSIRGAVGSPPAPAFTVLSSVSTVENSGTGRPPPPAGACGREESRGPRGTTGDHGSPVHSRADTWGCTHHREKPEELSSSLGRLQAGSRACVQTRSEEHCGKWPPRTSGCGHRAERASDVEKEAWLGRKGAGRKPGPALTWEV